MSKNHIQRISVECGVRRLFWEVLCALQRVKGWSGKRPGHLARCLILSCPTLRRRQMGRRHSLGSIVRFTIIKSSDRTTVGSRVVATIGTGEHSHRSSWSLLVWSSWSTSSGSDMGAGMAVVGGGDCTALKTSWSAERNPRKGSSGCADSARSICMAGDRDCGTERSRPRRIGKSGSVHDGMWPW